MRQFDSAWTGHWVGTDPVHDLAQPLDLVHIEQLRRRVLHDLGLLTNDRVTCVATLVTLSTRDYAFLERSRPNQRNELRRFETCEQGRELVSG